MEQQFLHYIQENDLASEGDKILVAVSGGKDSMALLHLFQNTNFNIAAAHCNFSLRGAESDGDEQFVTDYCNKHTIHLHHIRFDTLDYCKTKKLSIQMAARELRYNWFNELVEQHAYSKIAIAHNLNDVAETFFINLIRGTGIKGLTGITVKNGRLIRPLLFASRSYIDLYIEKNAIPFREDSSNAETKYLRNAIRHKIIPELEKLAPSFLDKIMHTNKLLREAGRHYHQKIDELSKTLLIPCGDKVLIEIEALTNSGVTPETLFEILHQFGFSFDTCAKILSNKASQPGMTFYSPTHLIVKDRTHLILTDNREEQETGFYLVEDGYNDSLPVQLSIKQLTVDADYVPEKAKNMATFDADLIQFPLILRRWQEGDYFYPFGMEGKKKLSDYFSDHKFSLIDKKEAWLLLSGNDIIWLINQRTDNRFRVTKNTRKVICIEWIG